MISFQDYDSIFSIIKYAIWGNELEEIPENHLESIYNELMDQAIVSLTLGVVKKMPQSNSITKRWTSSIYHVLANNVQIQVVEQRLHELFEKEQINAVTIKGSGAAIYYPDSNLRARGDIDILVHPNDFDSALLILSDNGYIRDERYNYYEHVNYSINHISIELHRYFIDGIESSVSTIPIEINPLNDILYDAMDKRCKRKIGKCTSIILPDAENGLVLLQHIKQHIKKGLGLRQIIDWMLFVYNVCDDTFWETSFFSLVEKTGLTNLAKIITRMCIKYLGLPDEYEWCGNISEKYCDYLMEYIIDQGNFGKKKVGDNDNYFIQFMSDGFQPPKIISIIQKHREAVIKRKLSRIREGFSGGFLVEVLKY